MITIKRIQTPANREAFITLPWKLYRADPAWVPHLISERKDFFNPDKNPFFRHSRVELIMAYRDGQPVGRMSVHENIPHVIRHKEKIGFFGFFECIDDQTVANALFNYAQQWLQEKGYRGMRGPMSFSINGEYALLVDGFQFPPMIQMSHNRPYYQRLLEQYGFIGSQDMFAYQLHFAEGLPDRIIDKAHKVEKNIPGLRVRSMNIKEIEKEAKIVHYIYTKAWNDNWGAVPMSEEEVMALAKELKFVIDPDIALVAELHGEPIGFSLSLPDINQALKKANGRLFPFGLIQILQKKRHLTAMRVFAMGVLNEYRHRGIDTIFYQRTLEAGLRKGYLTAEMSLINESNKPMRRVLERLGARIYKTYRMYDKKF